MPRFLLLDFDGVICTRTTYNENKTRPDDSHLISELLVNRVQEICDAVDAQVVISSSWQLTDSWSNILVWLRKKGLRAHISGFTTGQGPTRSHEIQFWMLDMGIEPNQVVILDDEIIEPLKSRWVRTTWASGLTEEKKDEAIKLFQ